MIVLCTHNDGGVGKTTLAVHIAGVLLNRQYSTLLVDCDDQADFWQFYIDRNPEKSKDWEKYENSIVMYADQMYDCQEEMQNAIYHDRKYIWDYEGSEHLYDYFVDLLDG